jgi:hypothetical protein
MDLLDKLRKERRRTATLTALLIEALEYFEVREDISCETTDDGAPLPNEEMVLAERLREAIGEGSHHAL